MLILYQHLLSLPEVLRSTPVLIRPHLKYISLCYGGASNVKKNITYKGVSVKRAACMPAYPRSPLLQPPML